MDTLKYQDMVRQLKKKGHLIVEQMTPDKADLLHMAVGVAGEGGELLDAVKRHTIYDKPLDRTNVVEELGDLEFFLEGVRQNLGITRKETLQANFDKLGVRYKGHQYSDAAAHARVDKVEEPKPGTLAYAEKVHADMTDRAPKHGETAEQATARRDYYRGHDDDGLPCD